MATNFAIDSRLLEEAQKVGGHRTKKETVTEALHEYIRRRKQARIVELLGALDFDPDYDYKNCATALDGAGGHADVIRFSPRSRRALRRGRESECDGKI